MILVDSHFHLRALTEKGVDPLQAVEEARRVGVCLGIDIGIDIGEAEHRGRLAADLRGVYLSHGLSPACSASPGWRDELPSLETLLVRDKVVALGEIGLDWHWGYGGKREQRELFEAQLRLAGRMHLPVVIHNREADADTLECLRSVRPSAGGVMHCFGSSYEQACACIDLGFAVSFAGNLSYRSAGDLREVARRLPEASILVETDAPYLAPQPVRGSTNRPENVRHVYELMADLRGVELSDLAESVLANFHRVFPLVPA